MQGRFKMEYRLFTIVRYNYGYYNICPCAFSFLPLCLFLPALLAFRVCPCALSSLPVCLFLAALVPLLFCPWAFVLHALLPFCYSTL